MDSNIYGWVGKILKIDLSRSTVTELNTWDYAERYLGGRGIATRLYWESMGPDIHAFDPGNPFILMSGVLVATGAQGATRLSVVSKSPMLMPEGFCYGNLGGFFPAYLKRAGFDGIVITGRAGTPVYLFIHDGDVTILDASMLWGKGTYEVQQCLKDAHGNKVRFISTGLAGENQCRNATIITDNEGSATGGFGAIMGSKHLKAIAVLGTGTPPVARRKELSEFNKHIIHISRRGTLRMPVSKKKMQFIKTASCYQCAMECGRGLYRTNEGREEVRKCQSMIVYMPYAAMKPEEGIDTVLDATRLCNDYSICTMEIQNILLWLGACYQAGFISDRDTGLDFSSLGSLSFFNQLVSMIARREGFGNILAEGIMRAAESLGDQAKTYFNEFINSVGLDGVYAPREYPITALLYGMEPRQPIAMLHDISHLIARWLLHRIRPDLSPTTAHVFRNAARKFWGHDKAWDMTTMEGKAIATVKIQDHTYVKDSLGLCDFGWPIMDSFNTEDHTGDPALESRLFSIVTGIDTSQEALDHYGQRIFNLQRAILLREGWQPPDDDRPKEFNFEDPVEWDLLNPNLIVPGPAEEPVSIKGNILDRSQFETMRKEFYELRGWNPDTGLQKKLQLEALGLSDVAEELQKRDLLSNE
jgi:aldehyde:ferredoxin oxidoreductase